jgi:hypothetical protein
MRSGMYKSFYFHFIVFFTTSLPVSFRKVFAIDLTPKLLKFMVATAISFILAQLWTAVSAATAPYLCSTTFTDVFFELSMRVKPALSRESQTDTAKKKKKSMMCKKNAQQKSIPFTSSADCRFAQ